MKKLLNTLYITNEKAYLSLDGENIVCKLEDDEKFRLPFSNIENIVCFSYLGASPALMGKCAEYGIALDFLSPNGEFLSSCRGKLKGNAYLRREQYRIFENNELSLSQNTVAAKIANTVFLIKRFIKDYPELCNDSEIQNCIYKLTNAAKNVYDSDSKKTILGIEGNCAKTYFRTFNRLILKQKDLFSMTERTKRPPLDKVNAVLSFLYTIYTREFASAITTVGLDSYFGYYHELRSGRDSLACDMVEEVRCLVERLVLTMINTRIINEKDFEKQVSGAVLLNKDGRVKVLTEWQKKKKQIIVHPYLKEKIQFGLIPFVQCSLMAKYLRKEIDDYPCFLWKQVKEK